MIWNAIAEFASKTPIWIIKQHTLKLQDFHQGLGEWRRTTASKVWHPRAKVLCMFLFGRCRGCIWENLSCILLLWRDCVPNRIYKFNWSISYVFFLGDPLTSKCEVGFNRMKADTTSWLSMIAGLASCLDVPLAHCACTGLREKHTTATCVCFKDTSQRSLPVGSDISCHCIIWFRNS